MFRFLLFSRAENLNRFNWHIGTLILRILERHRNRCRISGSRTRSRLQLGRKVVREARVRGHRSRLPGRFRPSRTEAHRDTRTDGNRRRHVRRKRSVRSCRRRRVEKTIAITRTSRCPLERETGPKRGQSMGEQTRADLVEGAREFSEVPNLETVVPGHDRSGRSGAHRSRDLGRPARCTSPAVAVERLSIPPA